MRTKLACLCSTVALLFILGCTSHFGVKDKSLTVPDEFNQTEAAIASAEKSQGASYCPDKIAKAKELGKKGVETYWACRSAEGLEMLADARKLAKEAEACRPPAPPAPSPAAPAAPRLAPPASPAPAGEITFTWVHFDFDKATLTPRAIATLDETVKALRENPNITVELAGHTDSKGTDAYNQKLAERRVQSVRQYLTSKGIAVNRLRTVAFGESKPIADNKTEQGRAENRRVEIRVIR